MSTAQLMSPAATRRMSIYICTPCRSSLLLATRRLQRHRLLHSTARYSSDPFDQAECQLQSGSAVLLPDGAKETQSNYNSEGHDDGISADTSRDLRQPPQRHPLKPRLDIKSLLATPSWSVRSLLPDPKAPDLQEDAIIPKKLHHLLRLSALPLPRSKEEEDAMLATLHSQLHFVRNIQSVNTKGVKPLQSIRDETAEGIEEVTINMESLKDAFAKEEIKGRNRRLRRKRNELNTERIAGVEDWDPLSTAKEVIGRAGGKYFVVRSGKGPHETPGVELSSDLESQVSWSEMQKKIPNASMSGEDRIFLETSIKGTTPESIVLREPEADSKILMVEEFPAWKKYKRDVSKQERWRLRLVGRLGKLKQLVHQPEIEADQITTKDLKVSYGELANITPKLSTTKGYRSLNGWRLMLEKLTARVEDLEREMVELEAGEDTTAEPTGVYRDRVTRPIQLLCAKNRDEIMNMIQELDTAGMDMKQSMDLINIKFIRRHKRWQNRRSSVLLGMKVGSRNRKKDALRPDTKGQDIVLDSIIGIQERTANRLEGVPKQKPTNTHTPIRQATTRKQFDEKAKENRTKQNDPPLRFQVTDLKFGLGPKTEAARRARIKIAELHQRIIAQMVEMNRRQRVGELVERRISNPISRSTE